METQRLRATVYEVFKTLNDLNQTLRKKYFIVL